MSEEDSTMARITDVVFSFRRGGTEAGAVKGTDTEKKKLTGLKKKKRKKPVREIFSGDTNGH